ncbi:peptidase [Pontibacter sp. HJ8]
MISNLFNKTKKAALLFALLPALVLSSCDKDSDEDANPSHVLNKKAVGESARDLLSAEKYSKVVVELQYAQGFEPTAAAVSNLRSWMEKYMNKPGGIIVKQAAIPAPGKSAYSVKDLAGIEESYRTEYTRPDTIAIYFFFADSKYAEDTDNSKVLGVAYRNTSMALFEHTIRSMSGGIGQPDRARLESVILQHELGHILGLVNAGTPMQQPHQDAPHGRHCDNTKCLMHYTVETGNVVQNLLGGYTPVLDQNCINDLKANGGK